MFNAINTPEKMAFEKRLTEFLRAEGFQEITIKTHATATPVNEIGPGESLEGQGVDTQSLYVEIVAKYDLDKESPKT
jgi:hypothetical protein